MYHDESPAAEPTLPAGGPTPPAQTPGPLAGGCATAEALDIVVPVREGPVNLQLCYALRSWAANLPHRNVWIAGHLPAWAHGVRHLPVPQAGTKYQNTTAAVRAACEHPEVGEQFLLCNDDMFVMHPLPGGMPVLHRGLVVDVEQQCEGRVSSLYRHGMKETRAALEGLGHPMPLSYELHVPLPVDKAGMLHALDLVPVADGMHKRTVYGVLNGIGGTRIDDVKILHRAPRGFGQQSRFLSTMPDSFANGAVGRFIRQAFPSPCRYEFPGRR